MLVRYKCIILYVLYLPKYINAVLVTKLNKSSTLIHDFSIAVFRSYHELYLKGVSLERLSLDGDTVFGRLHGWRLGKRHVSSTQ